MAITSHFYDGPLTETAWATHRMGAPAYGVEGPDDWRVTAVAGADRTISIAPGKGFGQGVSDSSDSNVTLQLDPITQGMRWDLIVARRDWQPASGGPTYFAKVNGTPSQVIPSSRKSTPGIEDDQPLALVQVAAGRTEPVSIIDLRCWASVGGYVAVHDLAKTYLAAPGAVVTIGTTEWAFLRGTNGLFAWATAAEVYSPTAANGYATDGDILVEQIGTRRRVTLNFQIRRTGSSFPLTTTFSGLGAIIPAQARGAGTGVYLPVALSGGGGNNILDMVYVDPSSGVVSIRAVEPHLWLTGALFSVNCTYFV